MDTRKQIYLICDAEVEQGFGNVPPNTL